MGIPVVYRKNSGNYIASYDYLDYASGTGIKLYYPAVCGISGSNVYTLTPNALNSELTDYVISATSGNTTEANFDILFRNPAIVVGECLICYTLNFSGAGTGYITFRLLQVRNSVETQIGSCSGSVNTVGSGQYQRLATKMTLTRTQLAVNDTLRLEVVVHAIGTTVSIYCEPASRATYTEGGSGASIGSDCKVYVPFVIDL